jgi:phosphopantetheine--protein transferase-like protein
MLTADSILWELALKESNLEETADGFLKSRKFAVGNDLVFIPDFKLSLTEPFKNKVYTEKETAYCELFADSTLRFASTWAAKEAVYKALKQVDKSAIGWKKIEIIREKIGGQPHAVIHREKSLEFKINLSISHDGDYVWAIALIEKTGVA